MPAEERQQERIAFQRLAWIECVGMPPQRCVVSDVSDGGARIVVMNGFEPPTSFRLLLNQQGTVSRDCEVRWREKGIIGVRFNPRNQRIRRF